MVRSPGGFWKTNKTQGSEKTSRLSIVLGTLWIILTLTGRLEAVLAMVGHTHDHDHGHAGRDHHGAAGHDIL